MVRIKSITPSGIEDVYNMEVDDHHNYSVNGGFILHNCDMVRCFCVARTCTAKEPDVSKQPKFIDQLKTLEKRNRLWGRR